MYTCAMSARAYVAMVCGNGMLRAQRFAAPGVEHFGGKTWSPASEGAKNANWAKFDDQETDISLCQHCVTRFLADAGPARWIVGRSIEAQARQGTCAAFCVQHPTQNIPVAT